MPFAFVGARARSRVALLASAIVVAVAVATTACVGIIGDGDTDGAAGRGDGTTSGTTASALCGDIGKVSIHRLNRTEYDNTVRDLLGDTSRPAHASFPADDTAFGFDNNADVLSVSPVLLEAYSDVAATLAANALAGPARAKILTCDGSGDAAACARTILEPFAKKAWRRPVTPEELGELVKLLDIASAQGDGFERGIELALQVVLASPNFVYRAEIDPDPSSSAPHALGDYELASRLSYFLWSTMPDDALFAAADAGKLAQDPNELGAQVDRMLADPRAQALVDDFALQWLTAGLDQAKPESDVFPNFDEALRTAMLGETREYMRSFLFGDGSFLDMIDARYTWANDELASLYGLAGVTGSALQRVTLDPASHRGGILTQASVLTLTSIVNRTSPTRRGKWVLTNLMCDPPPPPPANVPQLSQPAKATSLRATLEQHRKDPACSGCHSKMDPIGLGMENFDGIGAWRTSDNGAPIDASGVLTSSDPNSGQPFDGTAELEQRIKADPRFAKCVAGKVFAYAVGRAPDASADGCRTGALTDKFKATGYRIEDLIKTIVTDEAFRMRRGG